MIVELDAIDLEAAKRRTIAMIERQSALGSPPQYKAMCLRLTPYERKLQGTIGELAVAKFLNLPINELPTFSNWQDNFSLAKRGNDVGKVEVRATRHQNGKLIVNKIDFGICPFVLAILYPDNKRVRLAGWIFGYEAKKEKYYNNFPIKGNRWYVGQEDLHHMDKLIGVLYE